MHRGDLVLFTDLHISARDEGTESVLGVQGDDTELIFLFSRGVCIRRSGNDTTM